MNAEEMQKIDFNDADKHIFSWLELYQHDEQEKELNRVELKTFFELCGATDKIDPELKRIFKSKHYGNKSRTVAMKAVWGAKYQKYREFCNKYVAEYEESTGKELPRVIFKHEGKLSTFSKTEGMRGFFADLTAYAFAEKNDDYTFKTLDLVTRARLNNGKARENGTKAERFRVTIDGYNKDKPFEPAGFPSDFPEKALNFIRILSSG